MIAILIYIGGYPTKQKSKVKWAVSLNNEFLHSLFRHLKAIMNCRWQCKTVMSLEATDCCFTDWKLYSNILFPIKPWYQDLFTADPLKCVYIEI